MRRRVKWFAATLALVFTGSSALLLTGSAAQAAPPPIVIGSCATTVQGAPGQPVSLSTSAVLKTVTDAVRAVPLLGPPIAGAVGSAFAALPPIPIGALPTGTGFISGGTIANQVVAQLGKIPLLGPLVLAPAAKTVQGALTSLCGVTVTGVNTAAQPVQEGAKTIADASQQATGSLPGGGGTPGGGAPGGGGHTGGGTPGGGTPGGSGGGAPATGGSTSQPVLGGIPTSDLDFGQFLWGGRAPMADYGNIPFARAGLFSPSPGVRYGGSVSGYTPQFGILGAANPDAVQAAGHAEALRPAGGTKVALPVLLAVLALSCVTAVLVRTWVLRRVPAALR